MDQMMANGGEEKRPHPLLEQVVTEEQIWRGKLLDLWRDTLALPDGGMATREYIRHPGAVVVVAIDDTQQVVMARQYRHPVRAIVDEFPAGKLDPGESPLACGQRELREETGYTAATWRYLGAFWPCIGYSNEVIHVLLATDLTPGPAQCDEGEWIEVYRLPWPKLLARARAGEIRDGKTLAAIWLVDGAIN